MAATTKLTKTDQLNEDEGLAAGLQKNATTLPALVFAGASHPPTEMLSVMQARVAAGQAKVTTYAAYMAAVEADRAQQAETKEYVTQLKAALRLNYSNAPDKLADFSLVPPTKPAPKTALSKVVAQARGVETRKARGTVAPRDKAKVKGAPITTVTINASAASLEPPTVAPVATNGPATGNGTPRTP